MPATIKVPCQISRKDFGQHAKPLTATINGHSVILAPKEFTTGSLGFFANGKAVIIINGTPIQCQVNLLLTAVNSKDLPKEQPE